LASRSAGPHGLIAPYGHQHARNHAKCDHGTVSLVAAAIQWDCLPSTIDGATQLWSPAEPLLWSDPSSSAESLSLSVLSEHTPALGLMRRRIPLEFIETQNIKLQQLLEFLAANGVTLCVLPEYALLPSAETFDILAGFAPTIAIVAGIGLPRKEGVQALQPYAASLPHANNNCVVIFSGDDCQVVTKKYPAVGEVMEPGAGPSAVEIKLGGTSLRVGVAICMDYVREGHNVPSLEGRLDVLAIPALSQGVDPFRPDAPRDFPRIFANAANLGGSTVYASGCVGPLLAAGSPLPLPAMSEGVVALKWEGPAQKPTAIRQSPSRIQVRGAVLTPDSPADRYKIAEAFLALARTADLPDSDQLESLERWTHRLGGLSPVDDPLLSTIALYRRAVADDTLTSDTAALVRSHLLLREVKSMVALRADIAARCCREIQTVVAPLQPSDARYAQLLEAAQAYSKVAGKKEFPPSQAEAAAPTVTCHFSLGLGPFDGDEAEATLSEQLDLLRSYARSGPLESRLVFRLETTQDAATGQIGALFHIAAFGKPDAQTTSYFSAFERLARPVYLRGWSISGGAQSLSEGAHVVYICPARGVPFQVREDWGVLVDVLRSVGPGCDLELEGWSLGGDQPSRANPRDREEPSTSDVQTGALRRSVGSSVEQFFDRPPDETHIGIRIRLRSPDPNPALAALVGVVICGDGNFEVRDGGDGPDPLPVPVNRAHRILHPPHGHIEGRGLESLSPLTIPLRLELPPKPGAILGKAVVARPFVDESVDVVLPDTGRTLHTYVVGRTGSGKTNTLKNIVRYDLVAGGPVIVIDPHGELYDYAVRHMGKRVSNAVVVDLSSAEGAPSINPLYLDARNEEDRKRNVEELVDVLIRRGHHEWYGPRFAELLRLSLESLHVEAEQRGGHASLVDVLELFESADLRSRVDVALRTAHRLDLQAGWRRHRAMRETEQAEVEQWFLSKIGEFSTSRILERALSGPPTVALEPALRTGGVILVRVPEVAIGTAGAAVVGSLVLERIVRFALRGGFLSAPRPASMVVDEFQKFVGKEFERLVPEARKFNIGLVLANQTLSQLSAFDLFRGAQNSAIQSLILGNVGNFIVQSIGQQDAVVFSKELGLHDNQLRRIGRYSAVVSVTAQGLRYRPFTVSLADSQKLPGGSAEAVASEVVERRMQDLEIDLIGPSDSQSEEE
jgi:hypothetical protein